MVGPVQLLRRSHAVVLCASSVRGAPPVLGAATIGLLRRGALVVNVGRPQLVDSAALLAAVRNGRVAGFGVDEVVVGDGAPAAHRTLMSEGRVLQTGHSAWWRDEALERGAVMFERAVLAAALGRPVDVVCAGPGLRERSG